MEIVVEIGTPEQKEQIEYELKIFLRALKESELEHRLQRVIVATDFSQSVNLTQNTTDYLSNRGIGPNKITVLAKTISIADGAVIILSPDLYTDSYDSLTRGYVIFHEVGHVLTKNHFPSLITKKFSEIHYFGSLYALYDEYFCDRLAFSIIDNIFPEKTGLWNDYWDTCLEGNIELLNDKHYYDEVTRQITRFRIGDIKSVEEYLWTIKQSLDEIAIATVHLFSAAHELNSANVEERLAESKFYNDRTRGFLKYIKGKYETSDHDLMDGYSIVSEYLKNFGYFAEENLHEAYVHILDI